MRCLWFGVKVEGKLEISPHCRNFIFMSRVQFYHLSQSWTPSSIISSCMSFTSSKEPRRLGNQCSGVFVTNSRQRNLYPIFSVSPYLSCFQRSHSHSARIFCTVEILCYATHGIFIHFIFIKFWVQLTHTAPTLQSKRTTPFFLKVWSGWPQRCHIFSKKDIDTYFQWEPSHKQNSMCD